MSEDTRPDSPARAAEADAERARAALPLDRAAVREIIMAAIGKGWNQQDHPAAERVTETVWPLLEHAQAAAAGSHEGIRLWMLDCGELVAKHRARAVAAEAKLAEIAAGCREAIDRNASQRVTLVSAAYILAIISTEEDRPPLTDSQCDRLRQMVTEYADGITAIRVALDMTEQVVLGDRAEVIARAREALKVLEGGEARGGAGDDWSFTEPSL